MKKSILAILIASAAFTSCRKESFEIRTPEQMQAESNQNELDDFLAEDTMSPAIEKRSTTAKFFRTVTIKNGATTVIRSLTRNSANQLTREDIEIRTLYPKGRGFTPDHNFIVKTTKEFVR